MFNIDVMMIIILVVFLAVVLYMLMKPTLDTMREDELEREEKRLKNSHSA